MTHAAPNPSDLPTDAAALCAMVLAFQAEQDLAVAERDALAAERDAVAAERDAVVAERKRLQAAYDVLAERAERLQHLLRKLRRLHFGSKSERLPEAQLQLGLEDTEAAIAQLEAEAERDDPALRCERAARRRANRGKLPAHPSLRSREIRESDQRSLCTCISAAFWGSYVFALKIPQPLFESPAINWTQVSRCIEQTSPVTSEN